MSNIYKDYTPPAQAGGIYYKPQDGVSVRFRIMSEPVVFSSEFKENLSTRYAWIMWNLDEGCAQVVVLPLTAYRMIAELGQDEDWGDPLESPYNVKLTRRGVGRKTQWSVSPSAAKEDLSEEAATEVKGINLISAIEASPSASSVFWLRDVVKNGGETPKSVKKKDDVIEDIGDEPINLDDIPF